MINFEGSHNFENSCRERDSKLCLVLCLFIVMYFVFFSNDIFMRKLLKYPWKFTNNEDMSGIINMFNYSSLQAKIFRQYYVFFVCLILLNVIFSDRMASRAKKVATKIVHHKGLSMFFPLETLNMEILCI